MLSGEEDEAFAFVSPVSTLEKAKAPFLVKEADGRLIESSTLSIDNGARMDMAMAEEGTALPDAPEDDGTMITAVTWLRMCLRFLKETRFAQAKSQQKALKAANQRWQRVTVTGTGKVDEKEKPKITAFVDGQQQAEATLDKWPGTEYPNMSKQGVLLFASSEKHELLRASVHIRKCTGTRTTPSCNDRMNRCRAIPQALS